MAQMTSPETDRAALVALYNATGGPNWNDNNNWLSDVPISEWHGVTTDDNGRVTALELDINKLRGEIPPELGNLANLEDLVLGDNKLRGEIPPELGNLATLRELDLSSNQLTGEIPPELGNLATLRELDLSSNQLSGEIPPELGNLATLEDLFLGDNKLSGEIPPELGNFANLELLHLISNQLSGEIPLELGNLATLRELDLSSNQLSGEIPLELGNLATLRELDLSSNQLSGEIPPELGNLANLRVLRLSGRGNQFSGCIPSGLEGVPDNDLSALHLETCDSVGGMLASQVLPQGQDHSAQAAVEDACAHSEEAASIVMTARFLPSAEVPADMTDALLNWLWVFEVSETAGRQRQYRGDTMFKEAIVLLPPLTATDIVPGAMIPVTFYRRAFDSNDQWEEWEVVEDEYTVPELRDEMAPEFCGFSLDELTNLQYVGRETVNGLKTRHYSATIDGEPWEMWIASDGRPAKVVASEYGGGFAITFSGWNEPITITAPVVQPTAETTTTEETTTEESTTEESTTEESSAEESSAGGQ